MPGSDTVPQGTEMRAGSNPQGAMKARLSSTQPKTPRAACSGMMCRNASMASGRSRKPRSLSLISVPNSAPGSASSCPASCSCCSVSWRTSTASPASAHSSSRRFSSSIPASQASRGRPWPPNGASPDTQAARSTRPGASAAHASACGPPPEPPLAPNHSKPSASATASTSRTSSATWRPGSRPDCPYPARSVVT